MNNKAASLMVDGGTFKVASSEARQHERGVDHEGGQNVLRGEDQPAGLGERLPGPVPDLGRGCRQLIGTAGTRAANCRDVLDAVASNPDEPGGRSGAPNRKAPICGAGTVPSTSLFFDDLENPASGNWTKQANWYYPQNSHPFDFDATYATSGKYNMWGDDPASRSDHSITKVSGVKVPAGKTTYLRFKHAYGFEDGPAGFPFVFHDGGVLEYSTNNGTKWVDARPLFVNNGYKGAISNFFDNPLKGRQAFVGESNGYISSRVNLSSLAGENVKIRFRIGSDRAQGRLRLVRRRHKLLHLLLETLGPTANRKHVPRGSSRYPGALAWLE